MTDFLNRWSGIGNLSTDVDNGTMENGEPWATFRVACDRPFTSSSDGLKADFIPVVCKRDLAKRAITYLKKGRQIYLEGRLSVRPYVEAGENRWVLEVEASDFRMLGAPSSSQGNFHHDNVYEQHSDTSNGRLLEGSISQRPRRFGNNSDRAQTHPNDQSGTRTIGGYRNGRRTGPGNTNNRFPRP